MRSLSCVAVIITVACILSSSLGFRCPLEVVPSSVRGKSQRQIQSSLRRSIASTSSSSSSSSSYTTTLEMATWSNGQAIKEYQDFLATGKSEIYKEDDGPSVIVRSCNPACTTQLTDAIVALGNGDDVVLIPQDPLPPGMGERASYPIYITLPPYELREFIQNLNEEWKTRANDFIFFSGTKICGVVEPILRDFGMCRDTMSQVVIGFTLPTRGSGLGGVTARKPEDLACNIGADAYGEEKWAGETQACGKWNGAVACRLESNGIRCKSTFYREWRRAMWERALYDAVWNVVGAVREDKTDHYQVAAYFETEASDMMWELVNGLRGGLAVTLIYGFEDRLFSFAEMRGKDEPCELIDVMFDHMLNVFPGKARMLWEYCNYAKDRKGLLQLSNVPPVPSELSSLPSKVRTGNLRADGVI